MKNDKKPTQEDIMGQTFGEQEEVEEEPVETEEEPVEEEPVEEEVSEEEPIEEEEISPEEELESLFTGESEEEPAEEDESSEEEEEPPVEEDEPVDLTDLSDEEFEEVTTSRKAFADYIKKVQGQTAKSLREETQQAIASAKEEILQNIPDVVGKAHSRRESVRQLTQNFYTENPELRDKRSYVKDMTAVVSTQNPDWKAADVLKEVATRAKRDLGISEKAESREKERKGPKFAGAGGRRAPSGQTDNRSKQEKLLDETFGDN